MFRAIQFIIREMFLSQRIVMPKHGQLRTLSNSNNNNDDDDNNNNNNNNNSGSTRPGVKNKILRDKNIEHRDR